MNNGEVLEWQKKARCKGVDTSLFFEDENPHNPRSFKEFCDGCIVKSDCLGTALIYGYSGIWGGTTEKERHGLSQSYVDMLKDDYEESGMYNSTLKV